MFLPGDSYSEAIVHFIGLFAIQLEDARARLDYDPFSHWSGRPADPNDLPNIDTPVHVVPDHGGYAADVALQRVPTGPADFRAELMHIRLPQLHPVSGDAGHLPQQLHLPPGMLDWPELPMEPGPGMGTEIGSVALIVAQYRHLGDDDFISTGSAAPEVELPIPDLAGLDALTSEALTFSAPFADLESAATSTNVAEFMQASLSTIQAMPDQPDGEAGDAFVAHAPAGTYVDGELVDAAPSLMDELPDSVVQRLRGDADDSSEAPDAVIEPPEFELPQGNVLGAGPTLLDSDAAGGADQGSETLSIDPETMVTSMTVDAGGNVAINEATVANAGLNPVVLAVAGDVYEIDAIVQVNAYSDVDSIVDGVPGADRDSGAPTKAFNIATFEQQELDTARRAAEENPDSFPENWQISVVEGDLIFMDWISQYSFTSDHDGHVLTATGTTTTITSGENLGLNTVSFSNLGNIFDLVMVAGNFYDGNFILQTNVLQDNDRIETIGDLPGARDSDISTSDNLLWNQAGIVNVGANDWGTLGGSFFETFDALSSGQWDMPDVLETENALAGLGNLKVLYVSGSIYDLHYIKQVNVVGDSDFVALFEEKTLEELDNTPGSEWHISTGSNALINAAGIIDYDTVGHSAFVGGDVYADAILIQAEIVETAGSVSGFGDDLATELLAFLEDATGDNFSDHSDDPGGGAANDAPSYDGIGSMLT